MFMQGRVCPYCSRMTCGKYVALLSSRSTRNASGSSCFQFKSFLTVWELRSCRVAFELVVLP